MINVNIISKIPFLQTNVLLFREQKVAYSLFVGNPKSLG